MKNQQGISLIEVMVSVFILASGLLGLAALQSRSIAMNQSAHYRSIAADLAADLADRIRAYRSPYFGIDGLNVHPDFLTTPNFAACAQTTGNLDALTCGTIGGQAYVITHDGLQTPSNTSAVVVEMSGWNTALRTQLPNARFTLVRENASSAAFNRYTLTITWLDDRTSATDSSYVTVIE